MALESKVSKLWSQYVGIAPLAKQIHALLLSSGDTQLVNDHIAFRTWGTSTVNIKSIAQHFESLEYKLRGEYYFENKRLYAQHFEHMQNPTAPKIFISELQLNDCSPFIQEVAQACSSKVSKADTEKEEYLTQAASLWQPLVYKTYQKLLEESEYAAWLYAFGICANHFTILVNALKNPQVGQSLEKLNALLKNNGFKLNSSGGEIKGSPKDLLQQSSTLADTCDVIFEEKTVKLPSCYYEFAKRYPLDTSQPDKLYSGFVAASADKIFESTDVAQQQKP